MTLIDMPTVTDPSAPVVVVEPRPVSLPAGTVTASRWVDEPAGPGSPIATRRWANYPALTFRGLWWEDCPAPGNGIRQTRITHTSGLYLDYWGSSDAVYAEQVATGQVYVGLRTLAVEVLHSHTATLEERAAAITAVHDLDVIGAYCVCGGYLHYGTGRVWRHVNVCDTCLSDPAACPTSPVRRDHAGCARPAAAQCEHNCRRVSSYAATQACGDDRRCCGEHDCDTAMPAKERAEQADPLDGQTFQIVPTPRVAELHFDRPPVLSGGQRKLLADLRAGR